MYWFDSGEYPALILPGPWPPDGEVRAAAALACEHAAEVAAIHHGPLF